MLEGFLRLGMIVMMPGWQIAIVEILKLIAELLCIKHHYFSLDQFNADEVDVAIEYLCTI